MPEAVNLLWLFWWQPQQHVDVIEMPPRALVTITSEVVHILCALVWTDTRVRHMESIPIDDHNIREWTMSLCRNLT